MIFTVSFSDDLNSNLLCYFFVLYSNLYSNSTNPVWYEVNNNNNNIQRVIIK